MPINYKKDSEILKAIAHPVRLQMVRGLSCNECNVNKIVDKLGIPQSTISQHLSVLRKAGVITFRKEGVKTCYKVTDEKIKEIINILNK
ncbi:MAG: metalloregulator ArsR/SmtB family transcription factor [bacterium]|nr:metalloregulator ArsR/SmtB family transcription factor [bacterium]